MLEDILKIKRYLVEYESYTYDELDCMTEYEIVDIYNNKFES